MSAAMKALTERGMHQTSFLPEFFGEIDMAAGSRGRCDSKEHRIDWVYWYRGCCLHGLRRHLILTNCASTLVSGKLRSRRCAAWISNGGWKWSRRVRVIPIHRLRR